MQIPQFLLDRGITQICALDFETYYDTDYTLKKMSTSLYIFDERFHAFGAGIRLVPHESQSSYYHSGLKLDAKLKSIDWSVTALLAHHAHFDGLILSHHYWNIQPKYLLCTLSMARPWYKNTVGVGLNQVAKDMGYAGKTSDILTRTKGLRILSPSQDSEMAEYCNQDGQYK